MIDSAKSKYLIPIVILAALAIGAVVVLASSNSSGKAGNTNAGNLSLKNSNINASNSNAAPLNTNANVNGASLNTNTQSANLNANSTVNSNTNSNTNSVDLACQPVSQVIENAGQFDNQTICVLGYYQNSFEFSALAGAYRTVNGNDNLTAPYIWVDGTVPESLLNCRTSTVGQKSCFGQITLTGLFQYTTADPGFGHLGNYQYQLSNAIAGAPSQLPD